MPSDLARIVVVFMILAAFSGCQSTGGKSRLSFWPRPKKEAVAAAEKPKLAEPSIPPAPRGQYAYASQETLDRTGLAVSSRTPSVEETYPISDKPITEAPFGPATGLSASVDAGFDPAPARNRYAAPSYSGPSSTCNGACCRSAR